MPNTWRYTDVYAVIIHYITTHLDPTNYLLNFGIIELHEVNPRAIVKIYIEEYKKYQKTYLDTINSRCNLR